MRVELEGIQGLEHRDAGLLEAAVDAALAAPGHCQVPHLREVLRGRRALAGGLGGQRPPLGGHRRQAQGLEVGHQEVRGRGDSDRQTRPPVKTSEAATGGAETAIRARSARTVGTGRIAGRGPAARWRTSRRTVSRRG